MEVMLGKKNVFGGVSQFSSIQNVGICFGHLGEGFEGLDLNYKTVLGSKKGEG